MNNYMQTIISGIKTWARNLKSDWNENDPAADGYIKNRPFYTDDPVETAIVDNFIDTYADSEGYGALWNTNEPPLYDLIRGEIYTVVWDGVPYECIAVDDNYGGEALGNFAIINTGSDTGEPFFIYEEDNGGWRGVCTNEAGEHTVSILQTSVEIHKIEDKYLTQSDWDEDDSKSSAYIKNKPFSSKIYATQLNPDDTNVNIEGIRDYDSILISLLGEETFAQVDRFVVTWDGVEYPCEVKYGYNNRYYIGNGYLADEGDDTGEPFCVVQRGGYRVYSSSIGKHTIVISGRAPIVFTPENEGWTQEPFGFKIVRGDTYIVTWDGHQYELTSNDYYEPSLGNINIYFEEQDPEDSDLPPFFIIDGGILIRMYSDEYKEYHTIMVEQIHKIDSKYVNGKGMSGTGFHAEIFNNYELDSELVSHINIASGDYSHAEGCQTTASGGSSHAEGYNTTASGTESHAENASTTASGYASHAEGHRAIANAYASHAEGYGTVADGYVSHAEGWETIAHGSYQHVQGCCNIEDADSRYAHIVGNGDAITHSNAHTLDWQGNGWYAGSLFVGGTSQDDADEVATKQDFSKTRDYLALTDVVNGNVYIVEMKDGNLVSRSIVASIKVTTSPNKTEYIAGERFDSTGMIVTATCQDGSQINVTDYEYDIIVKSSNVMISYEEAGNTYTTTLQVDLTPYDAEAALIDFEYTANSDNTYTITGWKGTLNGEPSTEMVVPDNGLIKL